MLLAEYYWYPLEYLVINGSILSSELRVSTEISIQNIYYPDVIALVPLVWFFMK
jgi:hypothetical protein